MKIKIALLILLFTELIFCQLLKIDPVKKHISSFAIIIDRETYNFTKDAITAYRNAVENDGLSTYIIVND